MKEFIKRSKRKDVDRIIIKKTHSKRYIYLFLFISMIYIFLFQEAVGVWVLNNQNHLMKDSINVARVYALNIEKSIKAKDALLEMIDERLIVAGTSLLNLNMELSNTLMETLARDIGVDVIYAYSAAGVIEYTNEREYLGWRATPRHPVKNFMDSQETIHIDELRRNVENNQFYKYGYVRLQDGRFFQIGIADQRSEGYLDDFGIRDLLNKIKEEEEGVLFADFIQENHMIRESTDLSKMGQFISSPKIRDALDVNQDYYELVDHDQDKVLEVYVPVYQDTVKIGTLRIGRKATLFLAETKRVVRSGFLLIFALILTLIFFGVMIYHENKKSIKLAYSDKLTGLYNDIYMKEFIQTILTQKTLTKKAVFLINIPYCRSIKMALGFEVGDRLFKEIAERLEIVLNKKGMLFRFRDDGFVFFVEEYQHRDELIKLSRQIEESFEMTFRELSESKQIKPEVGIVEIAEQYDSIDNVMKDAVITAVNTKEKGVTSLFFSVEMRNQFDRDEKIEMDLIRSFTEEEQGIISLNYQPKFCLKTKKVIGFEALARMNSDSLGGVSPIEFIRVAEERKLMLTLGTMVLEKACLFLKQLADEGYSSIRVAVNVSGIQLLDESFISVVKEAITRTGIKGSSLELEITETVLLGNYNRVNDILQNIRALGVEISMDDFGTGFSSLASIDELNIDVVKVDQHFISKVITGEEEGLITADIIAMAHRLGLKVVAEGVETEIQMNYLIKHDCDIVQGFYYSRPLCEKEARKILN